MLVDLQNDQDELDERLFDAQNEAKDEVNGRVDELQTAVDELAM